MQRDTTVLEPKIVAGGYIDLNGCATLSHNMTVTKVARGQYRIEVPDLDRARSIAWVTPVGREDIFYRAYFAPDSTGLEIFIKDLGGYWMDADFYVCIVSLPSIV